MVINKIKIYNMKYEKNDSSAWHKELNEALLYTYTSLMELCPMLPVKNIQRFIFDRMITMYFLIQLFTIHISDVFDQKICLW